MNGLECSEILYSKLNDELRIDAEYHKKKYLVDEANIKAFQTLTIGEIAAVSDGQHGYHEEDDSSPIHMLTAKNTKEYFANIIGAIKIAKWVDDNNKRSSLAVDDIILSTRGTVGKCAIVKEDVLPANLDQDVARILFNDVCVLPNYVLCYLNSKYGQDWMIRNQTGMVQQGLSLEKVRRLPIPLMTMVFQKEIKKIVEKAFVKKKNAERCYNAAQLILEQELNLSRFNVPTTTITVNALSNSFGISGRLDAEYYQPKYADLINALATKETVETLCNIHDNNFDPILNEQYQYIELANVGFNGEIAGEEKIYGSDLPSRARRKVKKGQIIVSSIEGSLQSCALITDDYDSALCSTGFYVLDSNYIIPETLLLLFKSEPIQELMKQRCSGTILTAISKEEFKKMPLPLIDDLVQKEIAKKVQKSFALREKAYSLIQFAVKSVEIAIEQGEDVAIAWLKENVESLEV